MSEPNFVERLVRPRGSPRVGNKFRYASPQ
jgi:hypothetical protein